jgi:hypothetical protein
MTISDKPVVLPPAGVRGTALAMTVICAAQFVLQLDFSVVNVARPTIQRELGMAAAQWPWPGWSLRAQPSRLAPERLRRRRLRGGMAGDASRTLPDPAKLDEVLPHLVPYGITRDVLISKIGGSR